MSPLSTTDAAKLQKKLNTLAFMIRAADDVASDIFLTYHDQLMPHSHKNFISHLLSVAGGEVGKVQHDVEMANPSLQHSTSNRSGDSVAVAVDFNTGNARENKDTSNSCEDKVMRKRAQSAAAKEEVKGLQDVREKLAKMLGYKVHPPKKTSTGAATEAKEEGEGTA